MRPLTDDAGVGYARLRVSVFNQQIPFFERRRDLWTGLLVGLCCLLVYNANGRAISAGDTYPARYLPFAIWQHHTLLLDPIAGITAQGQGDMAYWIVPLSNGHLISLYPVALPVLVAPLYLPAVGYLHLRDWTPAEMDHVAKVMEKITASLIAAASAALLYLLLRRRAGRQLALRLTAAYAFGTTTWVISSQALWQHGMAQLLVIGTLLCLTAPCTTARAITAGLLCGLLAGNRPPDALLAAALGAYALFWAGRRAALVAAAAALPMGLVLFYNLGVAGHFAGGYGLKAEANFMRHDLVPGIAGLLLSPTRGLLVFSPFLLFLAAAGRHAPRDPDERFLTLASCVGVGLQVLLYAKTDWRIGISWGPRYLTDLVPLLIWMLVPVAAALRGFWQACFRITVGIAIAIQAAGAFCYTGATDLEVVSVQTGPDKMRAAWDWRNAPFIASLQHGLAPAELMTAMRGNFDALEVGGRATSTVTGGEQLVASGWALADGATPFQVAVFIDGKQPVVTQTFLDRPDVRAALRQASAAGWRLALDTSGLAPGEHVLAVLAWATEKGEARYLGERKLLVGMRGNFDAIEVDGYATSSIMAGRRIEATGWALAGHATPWQVAVVIDGRPTATSRTFFDRPDVRGTLGEPEPAGWRIPLDTADLVPGEHTLAAFGWASQNGERYYLAERKLTVRAALPMERRAHAVAAALHGAGEFEDGFKTAAARLRSHQQEPGYWLTAYTGEARYADPRPEMNTFLTALLLDLLQPLASSDPLGDSLERARRHLTDQIEGGGLVRYHGLPNGPGIGTLGCPITPDADDTALVWRLAPGRDRGLLSEALATLSRYRTREGLYRTWLAPRDAYQCLDPGSDPNPADIAIQMHVMQLLAEARPPAARALCDALRPVVDEDRIWVYYRKTPIVPILRLADLDRAGCRLELLESRMRAQVPGQEIWVSVAQLLRRARAARGSRPDAAEIRSVLGHLSQDDFALVRTNPPLLYHNDLSATVSRFYWSEDAGYALWLRLANELGVHP
jgi:hypothetical protein